VFGSDKKALNTFLDFQPLRKSRLDSLFDVRYWQLLLATLANYWPWVAVFFDSPEKIVVKDR
jgi:hypothetical protein